MDTTVTEASMREFFNSVISDFTGLSEQARKVEALSEQVASLSERIDASERENSRLRGELEQAWDNARKSDAEAGQLHTALIASQETSKALQETIVSADSRVRDLTNEGYARQEMLTEAEREKAVAEASVKDYEILVAELRQQLSEMTQERDDWKQDARTNADQIVELKETLSRVQNILNPPRPVSNVEEFPSVHVG